MKKLKNKKIEEELKDISPFLSDFLSKKTAEKAIPDGYFEALPLRLRLAKEKRNKSPRRILFFFSENGGGTKFKRLAAAACLGLLLAWALWLFIPPKNAETNTESVAPAQFSSVDVLRYLDNNIGDFQLEDLVNSGIITLEEIDYKVVSELSEEEQDMFINLTINDLQTDW